MYINVSSQPILHTFMYMYYAYRIDQDGVPVQYSRSSTICTVSRYMCTFLGRYMYLLYLDITYTYTFEGIWHLHSCHVLVPGSYHARYQARPGTILPVAGLVPGNNIS